MDCSYHLLIFLLSCRFLIVVRSSSCVLNFNLLLNSLFIIIYIQSFEFACVRLLLHCSWILVSYYKCLPFLPDYTNIFFFKKIFIYLFMAVLGLRFCARAFSSCSKWGSLFIAVRGPLTIAASLVAEHRLQTRRLSNCGSRA